MGAYESLWRLLISPHGANLGSMGAKFCWTRLFHFAKFRRFLGPNHTTAKSHYGKFLTIKISPVYYLIFLRNHTTHNIGGLKLPNHTRLWWPRTANAIFLYLTVLFSKIKFKITIRIQNINDITFATT